MYERAAFQGAVYTGLEAPGLGLDLFDLRTWPGFQQAWNYLRGKLEEFYTLPGRIGALKARGATLLGVAQQKGAATAAAEVAKVLDGLPDVEARHRDTSGKVSEAMSASRESGLGVIPWLAVSAIMTAAAGIKWLLDRVKHDEHTLDMIEQGLLTPAEAAALDGDGLLPKWGGNAAKLILPLAIGAGALFLLRRN